MVFKSSGADGNPKVETMYLNNKYVCMCSHKYAKSIYMFLGMLSPYDHKELLCGFPKKHNGVKVGLLFVSS